jgi:hypothetical protein
MSVFSPVGIKDPVKFVLDSPVVAYYLSMLLRRRFPGAQVIGSFGSGRRGFSDFAFSAHSDDGAQARPIVRAFEPFDVFAHLQFALFLSSMAGVGLAKARQGLNASLALLIELLEEELDLSIEFWLVTFESQYVMSPLGLEGASNIDVCTAGINGDDGVLEINRFDNLSESLNLASFVGGRAVGERQASLTEEGADPM